MTNVLLRRLGLLVLSVFLLTACGKSPEKLILGKWQIETEVEIPSNNKNYRVTRRDIVISEYLANGSNMQTRRMIIKSTMRDDGPQRELEYAFDITASREWVMKDGTVLLKVVDTKSTPGYLKRDGVMVTNIDEKTQFFDSLKKPEDSILRGQAYQLKIISLDKDRFVYEADVSGTGKFERVTATRTNKILRDLVKD